MRINVLLLLLFINTLKQQDFIFVKKSTDDLYIIKSQDRETLLQEAKKLGDSYSKDSRYVENDNINQENSKEEITKPLTLTKCAKKAKNIFCTTEIRLNGRKISLNSDDDDDEKDNGEEEETIDGSPSKETSVGSLTNFENVRDEDADTSSGHKLYQQKETGDRKHVRFKARQYGETNIKLQPCKAFVMQLLYISITQLGD